MGRPTAQELSYNFVVDGPRDPGHSARAAGAEKCVHLQHTGEELSPRQTQVPADRLVRRTRTGLRNGLLLLRRDHDLPEARVRGVHTVKSGRVHSRSRHQGCKSAHELQRFEEDAGRPVSPRPLQRDRDVSVAPPLQACVRERWAQGVPAQSLDGVPISRMNSLAGVEVERITGADAAILRSGSLLPEEPDHSLALASTERKDAKKAFRIKLGEPIWRRLLAASARSSGGPPAGGRAARLGPPVALTCGQVRGRYRRAGVIGWPTPVRRP